jgi:hypothetical protein
VLSRLAPGEAAAATVGVPIGASASIYTRVGDGPLTAVLLLLPCAVGSAGALRSRRPAGPAAPRSEGSPLEKEA